LEKITAYGGAVAHRRLLPQLTSDQRGSLRTFADEVWGLPFNDSPYVALRAVHRRNGARPTQTSYFCSELVATAYQRFGVLRPSPEGRLASNYVPSDFSEEAAMTSFSTPYHLSATELLKI
jgi:hypothetical protein